MRPMLEQSILAWKWENLQRLHMDVNFDIEEDEEMMNGLPNSIGLVSSLTSLDLCCQIKGSIPTELGNLSDLQQLSIRQHDFQSTIPSELFELTKLTSLRVERDNLSNIRDQPLHLRGTIPTEIGQLSDTLQVLSFYGAGLITRPFPSEIQHLSRLERLDLTAASRSFQNNQNIRTIPSVLGTLTSLRELRLGKCDEAFCVEQAMATTSLQSHEKLRLECHVADSTP